MPNSQFRTNFGGQHVIYSKIPETTNKNILDHIPNGNTLYDYIQQEYILQSIPKAALIQAAKIAQDNDMGIVVRPTSLLAHMAFESGSPTKPMEIKNKTSKWEDLLLCDELEFKKVGAVVHYDPRTEKGSQNLDKDWLKKEKLIINKLRNNYKYTELDAVKKAKQIEPLYRQRCKEFDEEDPLYHGQYSKHVLIDHPYLKLKELPTELIYGDLDLFCFTDSSGTEGNSNSLGEIKIAEDKDKISKIEDKLLEAEDFQAQHGAIYYWQPDTSFNCEIKAKIMSSHDLLSKEPLILIDSKGQANVVMYDGSKNLCPATANKCNQEWINSTYTGKLMNILSRLNLNVQNEWNSYIKDNELLQRVIFTLSETNQFTVNDWDKIKNDKALQQKIISFSENKQYQSLQTHLAEFKSFASKDITPEKTKAAKDFIENIEMASKNYLTADEKGFSDSLAKSKQNMFQLKQHRHKGLRVAGTILLTLTGIGALAGLIQAGIQKARGKYPEYLLMGQETESAKVAGRVSCDHLSAQLTEHHQ